MVWLQQANAALEPLTLVICMLEILGTLTSGGDSLHKRLVVMTSSVDCDTNRNKMHVKQAVLAARVQ